MNKDFVYFSSKNQKIDITTYGFENFEKKPCIIFVHGFKGFKDWGFWSFLGNTIAGKGFFVISFNFSHNGVGDNLTEFTELDKFAENTFSRELEELNEIIEAYKNGFFGKTNNKKIFLFGHSRGGAISILNSKINSDISGVVLLASVSTFDRYSERQKSEWRKKGVFQTINTRTKQVMSLNVTLLDDLEKNKEGKLNIKSAVESFKKPLLIIHGKEDLAVPVKEAELLFNWSDKSKTEFHIIDTAGHTFDVSHPFNGTNEKLNKVVLLTESFLMKNIN